MWHRANLWISRKARSGTFCRRIVLFDHLQNGGDRVPGFDGIDETTPPNRIRYEFTEFSLLQVFEAGYGFVQFLEAEQQLGYSFVGDANSQMRSGLVAVSHRPWASGIGI